jgi:hypothetical protein
MNFGVFIIIVVGANLDSKILIEFNHGIFVIY